MRECESESERGEAMGGDGEFVPTREEMLESRGNFGSGGKNMATHEAMVEARLPLGARDACSKLLIPLNKCRVDSFYLPWKCEDERHGYEKCEYEIFLQRMRKMQEARQSQQQQQPQPQLATQ